MNTQRQMSLLLVEGCKKKGNHRCGLLPEDLECFVAYVRWTRSRGLMWSAKGVMKRFDVAIAA